MKKDNLMRYGQIAGLDKPVSRLVIGSMVAHTGQSEPVVRQWIRERDIRDQIVLIAKGAATAQATP